MHRSLRLLLLEIAMPLLLLGAAEGTLRWYVHRDGPPLLPRFFPFPITTGKYLAYEDLARSPEPLDVLLMGMSPMLRVNAGLLAERLSAALHRQVRTFNFAAPLQTVAFDNVLLRDLLLKIKKPRLIVFGVMPINLLQDETPVKTDSFVRSSPIFMAYDGTLSGRVYGTLLDHVYLIRYRELIRDRLLLPAAVEPVEWLQMAQKTDAVGDIPFAVPDRPVTALSDWELDYKRQFRGFDTIMHTHPLFRHLGELASLCAEHDIQLVLLNNAVHPLFNQLFPQGRTDYDRYLFRLRNTASKAHVRLCEPAADGIGPPALFQDTHHHNTRGSMWLTEQLAACLLDAGMDRAPSGE
jgi:hypothetical protein